ncbi:MAG: hypothetical protein JST54_10735 [Deltaproteobacteria bacterium]|nr:hypothetical protein [Deltaproteobacteria bacterium]
MRMPTIAAVSLLTLLAAGPAHASPSGLPQGDQDLSVGFWGAGGKNALGQGVEGTYSYRGFAHLSLGVAALEHNGVTCDAYGDAGVWALLSVAAGAGFHGSMNGALGFGPEAHLFFGLPIPIPVSSDGWLVLEPILRVTRLWSAAGNETLVQGGFQVRLAGPAPHLGMSSEGHVDPNPKRG